MDTDDLNVYSYGSSSARLKKKQDDTSLQINWLIQNVKDNWEK